MKFVIILILSFFTFSAFAGSCAMTTDKKQRDALMVKFANKCEKNGTDFDNGKHLKSRDCQCYKSNWKKLYAKASPNADATPTGGEHCAVGRTTEDKVNGGVPTVNATGTKVKRD